MQIFTRILIAIAVLAASFVLMLYFPRMLALPLLGLVLIGGVVYAWNKNYVPLLAAFMLFAMISIVPIDVSLENRPGPPRFLPVSYGLLAPANAEDYWHKGCVVSDGDPLFVLVW